MINETPQTLLDKAQESNKNGEFLVAEQYCKQALDLVDADFEVKAKLLLALTESLRRRGRIQEAFPFATEALACATESGNQYDVAKALSYVGNMYYYVADYKQTIDYYQQAIDMFRQLGSEDNLAIVLGNLAVVYSDIIENEKALEYHNKALSLHHKSGNTEAAANTIGNMGNVYMNLADFTSALEYYTQAYSIHIEAGRKSQASIFLGNIGNVYASVSDFPKALEYYHQTLAIHEELDDASGVARIVGNIGVIYLELGLHDKALEYYNKALTLHEAIKDMAGVARVKANIGNVYQSLKNDTVAIEYYEHAQRINEEIGNRDGVADIIGSLGISYRQVGDISKSFEFTSRAVALHTELGARSDVAIGMSNLGALYAIRQSTYYNPTKAEEYFLKAIDECSILGVSHLRCSMYKQLSDLYEQELQWEKCVDAMKMFQVLTQELQTEEATNQTHVYENRRKLEESERDRQVKLARFHEQEKILHNILPSSIADRIIGGERIIADSYETVSVFFSDIIGFTSLSHMVSPSELVAMLNGIFTEFDRIAQRYGLEKIKTIGDAYMAACGVPTQYENHAQRAALFALDVQKFISTFTTDFGTKIEIRIGLHCGSVVAGVIGESKFAYDLWGDAVNTASRMESHGEAGKIHISDDFRIAVETCRGTSLHTIEFIERGEMNIKGKGIMKTYFLECPDGNG